MVAIIILLILVCCVLLYATLNLLSKLETYEGYIEDQDNFIDAQKVSFKKLLDRLREIDSKQMFEKDDEVGGIFEQLKKIITAHTAYQSKNNG